MMKALKKATYRRHTIQALGALAFNGNLKGFLTGTIYKGPSKKVCVPVLNCYSCPGALGSCPIGSLQAVEGSPRFHFPFYVLGLIILFGMTLGRWFCGFLCPFGFLQDLLHKLPGKKKELPKKLHNYLKYLKYVFLVVLVFLLPMLTKNDFGISDPYFCKYVCPQGTLQAGIPLVSMNPSLQSGVGFLFGWKLFLALAVIILSVFLHRPFCKYGCPLGAMLGLFNPISLYHLNVNDKCIECNACTRVCPMQLEPYKTPNDPECIRCHACVHVCPTQAIEQKMGKYVLNPAHGEKAMGKRSPETKK